MDSIVEQLFLAQKAGIILLWDCLFFLVPEDCVDKQIENDFIIGDLDMIEVNRNAFKNDFFYFSRINIERNISKFIEYFVDEAQRDKLTNILETKLDVKNNSKIVEFLKNN